MFESIELTYLFLIGFFSFFWMKIVFEEKMPMYYMKLPIYIITTVIFLIYYFNNPINHVNISIMLFMIMSVISQIIVYKGYYWRIISGFGLGFTYFFFIISTYNKGLMLSNLQLYMLIVAAVLIIYSMSDNSVLEKMYITVLFVWTGFAFLYNNNILQTSFIMYSFSELILLSNVKIKKEISSNFKKKNKFLSSFNGEEAANLLDWENILSSDTDYYIKKRILYKKQLMYDYIASSISVSAHIFLSLYYVL